MSSFGTSDHSDPSRTRPQKATERVSAGHAAVPDPLKRLAVMIAEAPHNLVARADRTEMLQRHILECDAAAQRLMPTGRWMDLGTGGGLPGLVLAYRFPDVAWTLVDATAKKVTAVRGFAQAMQLRNVTVLHGRAESLAHEADHRGAYDGVVCRAVAPLPVLLELTRGFLVDGGLLVAMKGPAWEEELQRAAAAQRTLRFVDASSELLPLSDRSSWLVTMRAVGPPPTGYPRRDGIPKQQPLA